MATKTISELQQLNAPTDTDLLIISHVSGTDQYVTRSLSAGVFATKEYVNGLIGDLETILNSI